MIYLFGNYELNETDFCLFREGRRVPLEPRALRVLLLFVQNPGKLLTKDVILETVWKTTFVEESTLTRAITILRKQLGDDPRAPSYIETIPTLGYRFIAKVEISSNTEGRETLAEASSLVGAMHPTATQAPETPPAEHHENAPLELPQTISDFPAQGRRPSIHWGHWSLLLLLPLATAGTLLWRKSHHGAIHEEKKTIVLSDFDNTTGDAVFDGALREGLTVELEQSPVLTLVSEPRIRSTLRLMSRAPDARLTAPLAREVCQRTDSAAMLDGSIAMLGTQYVITLHATNCNTGDLLDTEQVQAARKEDVLRALSSAASGLRGVGRRSFNRIACSA